SKAVPEKAKRLATELDSREIQSAVETAVGFVGWPHNTLTSISVNANRLTDALESTFLPHPPKILFVCHSRGGLVARDAIANLLALKERGPTWRQALVGLTTFGT